MTNTLPSKNGTPSRPSSSGRQSAVGLHKHKRTATDIGLALITPIVGQEFLDRYGLRDPLNRGLKYGVKQVFSTAQRMAKSTSRALSAMDARWKAQ